MSQTVLCWDLETTNNRAKTRSCQPISIGACMAKIQLGNWQVLGEFTRYIRTEEKISYGALHVHQITPDMIKDADSFPQVMESFSQWILKHSNNQPIIMLAHNGKNFDEIVMANNFIIHGLDYGEFLEKIKCTGFVDTLSLLKNCRSKLKTIKARSLLTPVDEKGNVSFALGCCYQTFCEKLLEDAHDALADARALLNVMASKRVRCYTDIVTIRQATVSRSDALKFLAESLGQLEKTNLGEVQLPPGKLEVKKFTLTDDLNLIPFTGEGKTVAICMNCMDVATTDHNC